MKLMPRIEAAMFLGIGVELLDYFTHKCPKPHEARLLLIAENSEHAGPLYSDDELIKYSTYLNQPWPKPPKGTRPTIPDPIKEDIRRESHLGCAICGLMMKGEVAHIEPVAETLNNSPDNLIYLCPNHHTEYDFGFKPASNVTREEVKAAKQIRQASRRRVMRFESNATQLILTILNLAKKTEAALKKEESEAIRDAYTADLRDALNQIPELLNRAEKQAERDQDVEEVRQKILSQSPVIARFTLGLTNESSPDAVRHSASQVLGAAEEVLLELDEVDCPHCGGGGTTGLAGNFCKYCKGHCVVSEEKAETYDPEQIDEVRCPHCDGAGLRGLNGTFCIYCKGSCVVSRAKRKAYSREALDEAECPHCGGCGTTGLNQDYCRYCKGEQVVSRKKADSYDREDMDEVDCPHCGGSGTTGLNQDYCRYCRGSQVVSQARADAYDPNAVDEVECPHCGGSGTTGLIQEYCRYCKGSQVVSHQKAKAYDRGKIDEVECPHCDGSGMLSHAEFCPVCKGSCVITHEKAHEYGESRSRMVECPHCNGTGIKGLHGTRCNLCKGTRTVTREVYRAYQER